MAWLGECANGLFRRIRLHDVNGQIPVIGGQLPSPIFFFPEGFLIGKELFRELAFGLARWSVL